jgi:predicted DsbA family dithiol-disulfide isomerase
MSVPSRQTAGVTIEVFADVSCPFTHVGLRRLVARRADLGREETVLSVRAWPLELVNQQPLAPDFVAEEVEELRRQVAPDLFAGFDPDRFPSTFLPALALAAAGRRHGPRVGERVGLALRHALFEEGRDIGDHGVLAELAAEHGVGMPTGEDDDSVRADWEEGKRRGVVGSPHYFVGGLDFFCPSLDVGRVDGHLRVKADVEAFEAFLATCFPGGSVS